MNVANAIYQSARAALVNILANWFTRNPNSPIVSLGNWAEGKGYTRIGDIFNYTYFDMGKKAGDFLERIGLASDVNNRFIMNQIAQAKTFNVTQIGKLGPGTLNEMNLLLQNGYTQITSTWSSFAHIFVP